MLQHFTLKERHNVQHGSKQYNTYQLTAVVEAKNPCLRDTVAAPGTDISQTPATFDPKSTT